MLDLNFGQEMENAWNPHLRKGFIASLLRYLSAGDGLVFAQDPLLYASSSLGRIVPNKHLSEAAQATWEVHNRSLGYWQFESRPVPVLDEPLVLLAVASWVQRQDMSVKRSIVTTVLRDAEDQTTDDPFAYKDLCVLGLWKAFGRGMGKPLSDVLTLHTGAGSSAAARSRAVPAWLREGELATLMLITGTNADGSLNTQPAIVSLGGKPFPFQGFDAKGILEWLGGAHPTPFCLPTTGSNNGPAILTLVEVAGQSVWVAIWQEEKYRLHFQKWRSQSGARCSAKNHFRNSSDLARPPLPDDVLIALGISENVSSKGPKPYPVLRAILRTVDGSATTTLHDICPEAAPDSYFIAEVKSEVFDRVVSTVVRELVDLIDNEPRGPTNP